MLNLESTIFSTVKKLNMNDTIFLYKNNGDSLRDNLNLVLINYFIECIYQLFHAACLFMKFLHASVYIIFLQQYFFLKFWLKTFVFYHKPPLIHWVSAKTIFSIFFRFYCSGCKCKFYDIEK